ncbi:DUF6588 family protein [Flavobacterium subsaxonicum]|uniref:Uncharacterized protein n=1 Tax=Flavobacterium subsaxonicum WB 4.1-42 = DSM 21790 TaxID=1121898 RepID=A0A0A2MJY3_9FLAO|nr:DUF6588 family protein [Flavobacterium subsaxonicum]KGO92589.1 hypothetical protein Q766_12505 [Flavobacterium subsaxonicum WB 4.1-42 = DSM 21790]
MRKLTHKPFIKTIVIAAILLCTGRVGAQTEELEQVGRLISDALFFSDQYITPATDAAVYQAASGWITSPKKPELWDVTLALHTNIFFTPQRDRKFTIYNSDFTFFQLEEGTSATVPTALGNKDQVYLSGQLGDSEIRLETPQGMNMQVVAYPYLQGSLGLLYGTELVIKYSPQVNLKKSDYQVYGFGLKHNVSQYFKSLFDKKIHLAVLGAWSKEDVSFEFLNVKTDYGTLGINQINGLVDTYQLQASGSKEFGNFEVMGSFMYSVSDVKYKVGGETGTIEETIPLQQILNSRLKSIYKTRINYIGEAAIKYNIGKFNVQTILAFGKFLNTNVSLQYLFN